MTPAAVVFDNDGLTLDTEQAWTRAEELLFRRYGSAFTDDHKRDLLGSSRLVAAAKLEGHLLRGRAGSVSGLELVDELLVLVMAELDHGAPPMPGAVELVAALRAAGTPVGLASNSPRAFVDKALAVAGLEGLFDVTVAGDEVAEPKPAPDVYLEAAAALGAEPGGAASRSRTRARASPRPGRRA